MERNLERKTLSFGKGMTNVPSDLLSDDTELAESINFIYKYGGMMPIQQMKKIGNIGGKIMHIHKMADYENYIVYDQFEGSGTITWYRNDDLENAAGSFANIGNVMDVKSVGNTLIISTDKLLRYFLFKGSLYKELGTELPEPHFSVYFEHKTSGWNTYKCSLSEIVNHEKLTAYYDQDGNFIGLFNQPPTPDPESGDRYVAGSTCVSHNIIKGRETDYLNAVQGCVEGGIKEEKDDNRFMFPFFIRYAFKLYDGTYTRISAPIVCYPSISRNCRFYNTLAATDDNFWFVPYSAVLKYTAKVEGIENWSDIIKELTIFASDDVMPFYNIDSTYTRDWALFVGETKSMPYTWCDTTYFNTTGEQIGYGDFVSNSVILPRYKSNAEIIEELLGKTQFFKLASLKVTSSEVNVTFKDNKALPLKRNVVSTLTSQEQLKVDDYYGWTHLYAQRMFPYNNRINIFDLKRFPFKGFNNFLSCKELDGFTATYYVHIVSQSMDAWVKSEPSGIFYESALTGWLFYPDPNATEMIIHIQGNNVDKKIKVPLNSHQMLNGAYSFENLPTEDKVETTDLIEVDELPDVDEDAHETLDSQIFTSVVNNPFVFEASGDNTVGTGKIIGIIANTEAVSQGQFGQYPLLVFTDEGIYAMSVNSEGLYSNIYPVSREVCNNMNTITPTDKLVYFSSDKGLMAISGGEVACVSEILGGWKNRMLSENILPLKEFLRNSLIAYDYKESLLRIFNTGENYHYVYNMIDKTFSISTNYVGSKVFCRNVVNNYPDNIIQFTDSAVYSLASISDKKNDEGLYSGGFTTRPLKMGGSMTLKSLRAIKHLYDTDEGKVKLEVYASNDCKHWVKLTSLGGKPWKYFTFKYTLTDFRACDSFAGTIVEVQSRREDKMR